MSSVFVWSDQHFFHLNIIKYASRPFPCNEEGLLLSHSLMVNNARSVVSDEDILLFLGDVAFLNRDNKPKLRELITDMPGFKVLLRGNHDSVSDSFYISSGFSLVADFLVAGSSFFCHYPLSVSPESHKEKLMRELYFSLGCDRLFHGHLHNRDCNDDDDIKRCNVSVDHPSVAFIPLELTGTNHSLLQNLRLPICPVSSFLTERGRTVRGIILSLQ